MALQTARENADNACKAWIAARHAAAAKGIPETRDAATILRRLEMESASRIMMRLGQAAELN